MRAELFLVSKSNEINYLVFSSTVADLGGPKPSFLFMVLLSLKRFQFFDEWSFQILYADHPFSDDFVFF